MKKWIWMIFGTKLLMLGGLVLLFFIFITPLLMISGNVDSYETTEIYSGVIPDIPQELLDEDYVWPVPTVSNITSGLGYRVLWGSRQYHRGIDISDGRGGHPVFAMANGVVIKAGRASGFGQAVYIDHGNGLFTRYGHLQWDAFGVKKGDRVKKGQYIGRIGYGKVGSSTGPHLHFEVIINGSITRFGGITGTWVDPVKNGFVRPPGGGG
ncbi:MAG: M23 family metallopeptidase [Bacillaceae bacterium]|nr:M23 family metallopeptidase [Bacillaceae bacterium]